MKKGTKIRKWTQQELDMLKAIYPDHSNKYCSEYLHRSVYSIFQKAHKLGLRKTPEFARQQRECGQYKKGHVPFNKGMRHEEYMSEEGILRCRESFFKDGNIIPNAINYRPDGFECIRNEHGKRYIWIKPAGRHMIPKHRWLWEQAHGPIPEGYFVMFKDGDSMNCVLENLLLVNRPEHMRRIIARMPEDRKAEIRAKMAKSRKERIKADKLRLRWGLEPLGRIVKRI